MNEILLVLIPGLILSALKNAVLVDKLWRDVGEDPALSDWCRVAVYSKEDINNLFIKRLKNIKEMLVR